MDFTFARPPGIRFAPGLFNDISGIIGKYGHTAAIITGAHSLQESGKWDAFCLSLEHESIRYFHTAIADEPSPEFIDKAVSELRDKNVDVVCAIGGGSAIDSGKAISAMLAVDGTVFNYLEGVGKGWRHNGSKIPFVAVPTTAGTGSEATKNAVLSCVGAEGFKKSLRHDNFVPDEAVIDPELMLSCPADITAACGMDALTQLIESYVSPKSSPITDALAFDGLKSVRDNLLSAVSAGSGSVEVRCRMAYASLLSGITLANAGLGIVHGLASVIGGFYKISHGVICGSLLVSATRTNIDALINRGDNALLNRYARLGVLLSGSESGDKIENCNQLIKVLELWTEKLKVPMLREYNICSLDIEKIAAATANKNNPVVLNTQDIGEIIERRI